MNRKKRVAVIGASNDRYKFGNRALRAFASQGYEVLPVNPDLSTVEGLPAYASVLDIPGEVDMATFYVPPDVGLTVIEAVAAKGIPEVWLNPGSESEPLLQRARSLGLRPILACSIMGIGEGRDGD
jgi:predicted CoA-binding protein